MLEIIIQGYQDEAFYKDKSNERRAKRKVNLMIINILKQYLKKMAFFKENN